MRPVLYGLPERLLLPLLVLLAPPRNDAGLHPAASSYPAPASSSCVAHSGGTVGGFLARLALPASYGAAKLGGNFYGAGGHDSTLAICLQADGAAGTVGWNWTRGYTDPACRDPELCKAPACFADFSYVSLSMGTSPFADAAAPGGGGSGQQQQLAAVAGGGSEPPPLPVDLDTLSNLIVSQNVSWSWRDTAPGVDPPETAGRGHHESRRVRFIYDLFLTSARPNGTNIAELITDEITISLAANPQFPGSQPPGCESSLSLQAGALCVICVRPLPLPRARCC